MSHLSDDEYLVANGLEELEAENLTEINDLKVPLESETDAGGRQKIEREIQNGEKALNSLSEQLPDTEKINQSVRHTQRTRIPTEKMLAYQKEEAKKKES